MSNKGLTRIRLLAATGLVTAALVSAPAKADHGHNYIAPLAAFITLNALFHHHHQYRWNHHRHHGHYGHHRPHKRRHSHSHGGYHGPRHKRHRH